MSMNEGEAFFDQGTETHSRWRRKPYVIGGAAVLFAAGFGLGFGVDRWTSKSNPKDLATGVVACANSQLVEGVLIDGSGWADITPQGNIANSVTFRRAISAGHYTITVGCAGTPEQWAITDHSVQPAVTNFPAAFNCDPSPAPTATKPQRQGTCLGPEVLAVPQG